MRQETPFYTEGEWRKEQPARISTFRCMYKLASLPPISRAARLPGQIERTSTRWREEDKRLSKRNLSPSSSPSSSSSSSSPSSARRGSRLPGPLTRGAARTTRRAASGDHTTSNRKISLLAATPTRVQQCRCTCLFPASGLSFGSRGIPCFVADHAFAPALYGPIASGGFKKTIPRDSSLRKTIRQHLLSIDPVEATNSARGHILSQRRHIHTQGFIRRTHKISVT